MTGALLLAAALLCGEGCTPVSTPSPSPAPASGPRPDVLVQIIDDLGYGQRDPNIDGLAEAGTHFRNHRSRAYCTAGRYQLITGQIEERWAHIGGLNAGDDTRLQALPATKASLAEQFLAAGYETRLCGKWHLGDPLYAAAATPLDHGFEHATWEPYPHGGSPAPLYKYEDRVIVHTQPTNGGSAADVAYRRGLNAWTAACVANAVTNRDPARPLFLWVGWPGVHGKVEPELPLLPGETKMDAYVRQTGAYAAAASASLPADTYRLTVSDNGAPLAAGEAFNAPMRGEKGQSWDGGIRVIAGLSGPGVPQQTIDDPVAIQDFYPTLLELSGIPLPTGHPLDGESLVPLMSGTGTRGGEFFLYDALIQWPWKFKGDQLWNLVDDPGETAPIVNFTLKAAMKARLNVLKALYVPVPE